MNKELAILALRMKSADLTEKGRVTILANGLNIEDAQGDISVSGSFAKTLNDFNAGKRSIFHYKNHDKSDTIGFVVSGKESATDLVLESQLNLNKQIGREVYEDYKLAQELGKNIEHSIGVYAIKRDKSDSRKVLEWQLEEVSTLTKRGANPSTGFINLKSIDSQNNPLIIMKHLKAAIKRKYSDDKLSAINSQLELLEKSLIDKQVQLVQCPHCAFTFDYNSLEIHSFDSLIIDTIINYRDWAIRDIVQEEINKLEPQLREQVINVISNQNDIKNKSIEDILNISYVYCPKCYAKVYNNQIIDTHNNEDDKKPSMDTFSKNEAMHSTLSWQNLRNVLIQ